MPIKKEQELGPGADQIWLMLPYHAPRNVYTLLETAHCGNRPDYLQLSISIFDLCHRTRFLRFVQTLSFDRQFITDLKESNAISIFSIISEAKTSGSGRLSKSSMLASLIQVISKLTLSLFITSS